VLGWRALPWQRWLLIHALELLPDGRPRFRTVLVLVARQNGKTALLVVLALFWLFVQRKPLVLGTSTNLDYARESWEKAVQVVEEIDDLTGLVPQPSGIRRTNGEQTLTTADRCRYKIATASRRGGRSLTVHRLILDELREHHDYSSWSAATKAMNAVSDGQVWALSNAGDDASVVLNDLRDAGRAGSNPRLGLFEWSGPDDLRCTCDRRPHAADCMLQDRSIWAQANPSIGYTIGEDVIAADLDTDPVPVFLTEDLCIRVQHLVDPPIMEAAWDACADPGSSVVGSVVFAVSVSIGGRYASIAVAGFRGDGLPHGELVDNRPGTDWVVRRVQELQGRHRVRRVKVAGVWRPGVFMDSSGPAGQLLTSLRSAGVDPVDTKGPPKGQSCGQLETAVRDGSVRLVTSPGDVLHVALRSAAKRDVGDGAWAWGRKKSEDDVSSLEAVTEALWGLSLAESTPDRAPLVAFV
jgi:hypothetical protein